MNANIYINEENAQRLFAIKRLCGKENQTAEQFIESMVNNGLIRMFPELPEVDELGNILNADCFKVYRNDIK